AGLRPWPSTALVIDCRFHGRGGSKSTRRVNVEKGLPPAQCLEAGARSVAAMTRQRPTKLPLRDLRRCLAAALALISLLSARPSSAYPALLAALAAVYPTTPGARSVAIGDINGDGKPDVVTVTADGVPRPVSVLLGVGDGSLEAHTDYAAGPDI